MPQTFPLLRIDGRNRSMQPDIKRSLQPHSTP
ncbi:hypothetical protein ABIC71_000212 [Herbaspirillum seropedicae]